MKAFCEGEPVLDIERGGMKVGKYGSVLLGIVLAGFLCAGCFPALAEELATSSADATCVHHPSHTIDCGYDAASCTYAENGCPYCVNSWEWVDDQGVLSETEVGWTLGLPGASQDSPITRDSLVGMLPNQVVALVDNGEKKELEVAWDVSAVPEQGASEGDYKVTASLVDAAYALADNAGPLIATLHVGGAASYANLPSGTPPFSEHIVNGVSPNGTTINLFDYWITGQTDSDGGWSNGNVNQGINNNHALLFSKGDIEAKNGGAWNKWTGNAIPCTKIVRNKLENGYPALNNLDTSSAGFLYGRDGGESLAYLFDPAVQHDGKESFRDVQGLLQVDGDGYYCYDSSNNYAVYYEDANSFALYDKPGVYSETSWEWGQFFPFNVAESAPNYYSPYMNGKHSTDAAINHYFGVHMSTRFIQQYGGHTAEVGGKEVTYKFSGDDDVWIFVDGTLVGDLGGIHNKAEIEINFATGKITVNGQEQTETLGSLLGTGSNTLPNNTYHTLDFFYLERGNADSNMQLRYNLVTIPESGLIKVDQVGDAVYGAEFTLYGALDYQENGLSGATPVAKGVTDNNGQFTFVKEENGGERPITIAELYDSFNGKRDKRGNNLVLVETKTPEGYRTCGEIGLYFYKPNNDVKDEVLLLADSEGVWENGAYAMPKVYATAKQKITLLGPNGGTSREEDLSSLENPTMFAVVFQKQGDNWYPVSGDPINGWKVESGNTWDDVLKAANNNPYIFRLTKSGAYQVEIDNLPGDVKTYYHICQDENQAEYTIAYYFTEAGSLKDAREDNTWRIDSESSQNKLDRVFAMDLYVTNMKNRLLVQKVDDRGEAVNGAQFSLYTAADVDVKKDANGEIQSVTPKEGAQPQTVTTQDIDKPIKVKGGAVFPDNVGNGEVLECGEYWLFETLAPTGYRIKTDPVHVVIDNTGVYADAGTKDDGVTVLRGVGSVARSVVQFAADDHVDVTLRDIKAALATDVKYKEYDSNGSFDVVGDGIDWDSTDGVLHLKYNNANKMLDYGLNSNDGSGADTSIDDVTLKTDEGWSKLLIRQCYKHDEETDVSLKTDLKDADITSLFSGTVTVRVANERTGNLKIRKQVDGDGAPIDQEFTFKISVEDDGTPISGEYQVLKQDGTKGSISFDKGEATAKLKRDESLTILALPTDASFSVEETNIPSGYEPSMTIIGSGQQGSGKVTGTIRHDTTEDAAVEVACLNLFSGNATVALVGTKTLEGRNLTAADDFTFSLEAGDDETRQAIERGDVVMPEGLNVTVNGDGSASAKDFSFGPMVFKKEGTYHFNIKENLRSDDNGVLYDTHTAIATVKVERDANTGLLNAVTSYENTGAPSGFDIIDKAVFVNRWAGLKVSKEVTGNMGDREKPFDFTIKLTGADGKPVTGAYPYAINGSEPADSLELDANGTGSFQLKHGQSISVFGLPAESEFVITETDAKDDGYTTTVSVGGAEPVSGYEVSGELTGESKVEVKFKNDRGNTPPTGIFLDSWPWMALAACAVVAGAVLILASRQARGANRKTGGAHFGR